MEVRAKSNLKGHLTEGKFYRIVDRTDKEYTIINDSKVKYSYPRKAFEMTSESQTKIVNPNTTVSTMPGSNAMWVVSEMPLSNGDPKNIILNKVPDYTKANPSSVLKVVYRKEDEIDIRPTTDVIDDTINNGGSTDYYKINPNWKDLQDIIEDRNMNYAQANLLKVAFTFNKGRHEGTDELREINKVIYFAERIKAEILNKKNND
jgi:hypothetical protein